MRHRDYRSDLNLAETLRRTDARWELDHNYFWTTRADERKRQRTTKNGRTNGQPAQKN